MKRLSQLEPAEVSLVPKGANKRKFLVLKSMGANKMTREELLKAISCEPSSMAKVEKVLMSHGKPQEDMQVQKDTNDEGPLSDQAQAACKAVVRILTPFKDSLSPLLLHQVLDAAGIQVGRAEQQGDEMAKGQMEKSARQSPEPIKEEHQIEATKIAKKAVADHFAKLGYKKYPDAEMAQKAADDEGPGKVVRDESGEEEEQEGTMHNPDVEKSAVAKMDLSGVPESAKRSIEAVFKAHSERTSKLEAELEAVKRVTARKELVQKAATEYGSLGLPTEELADTLLELQKKQPALLERVEKMLCAANEQAKKGSLFSEFGSSHSGGHIGTTWEAIEKAATGHVAKSGEVVTKEAAVDMFLKTADGKRMYNLYMGSHPGSK